MQELIEGTIRPFELDILLWPASIIFVFSLVATYKVARMPVISILVACVKSGVFLVYFGLLFDGTYTFLDDWSYLAGGEKLLDEGVTIFNLMENWLLILNVGGGNHIVYYLYNTYAFKFFGIGYFAPVACNILLSVLIAYFGCRLAIQEFGLSRRQGKWFYLFLLFQPDIFSWSNIMNGKDILVLLLHILLLQAVALFYREKFRNSFLIAIPVIFLLFFLRFYVPLLFVISFVLAIVIYGRISMQRRFIYLFIGLVLAWGIFLWIGIAYIQYAISLVREDFVNPFYGFIRILLTPIPFNTEVSYAFLNIPALLHWLMMPFVVLGVLSLRRRGGVFIVFFCVYIIAFMSLYAVCGELQGPRHRIQLDYAFSVLQFIGLLVFIKNIRFYFRKERKGMRISHAAMRVDS